ncbi:MAG: CoB--CoM heterodisulfide reductase subunit C [Candidatus Methanomethylophilaceae archaeon]
MITTEFKVNPEFEAQLAAAGGADVKLCFQCGTCTAGCPSGRRTSYRVRKLMRMAQLDMKEAILDSDELWECSTCYTCVERCPRQVPIVDIVVALRNIAVAEGHIRANHKKTATSFYKTGHTVPINDKIKAERKAMGLPEVPPTVLANKDAMDQLDKILDATGFNKIVE